MKRCSASLLQATFQTAGLSGVQASAVPVPLVPTTQAAHGDSLADQLTGAQTGHAREQSLKRHAPIAAVNSPGDHAGPRSDAVACDSKRSSNTASAKVQCQHGALQHRALQMSSCTPAAQGTAGAPVELAATNPAGLVVHAAELGGAPAQLDNSKKSQTPAVGGLVPACRRRPPTKARISKSQKKEGHSGGSNSSVSGSDAGSSGSDSEEGRGSARRAAPSRKKRRSACDGSATVAVLKARYHFLKDECGACSR